MRRQRQCSHARAQLRTLVEMGFDAALARRVLAEKRGNVDAALEALFAM